MKIKDLLKITGISLFGVLGVGLSIFGSAKGMSLLADNYSLVCAYSVNNNDDSVTFSLDELNNCSYPYLVSLLSENTTLLDNASITYLGNYYDFNHYDSIELYFEFGSNDKIQFSISGTGVWLYEEYQGDFTEGFTIYSNFFAENMQKSITLSASELNNNTYEYFYNYLSDNGAIDYANTFGYIIYNDNIYTYDDYDSGDGLYYTDSNGNQIVYNMTNKNWSFYNVTTTRDESFNNSITIYSTYIADNLYAPNQPSNLLQAIVSLLTGGIVGLCGGIGSGVSTLATQIFISNNALSVFGGMIVVFASISLAIGLCRWIMQFLTSLGAKK